MLPKAIRLIIFDVDGVLTNGELHYDRNGEERKIFSVRDGVGISKIQSLGIEVAILSAGRAAGAVTARAKDLDVHLVATGVENKVSQALSWLKALDLGWNQVAAVGDDIQDLELLEKVGWSFCPSDARPEVRDVAKTVLASNGGRGCAREVADLLDIASGV